MRFYNYFKPLAWAILVLCTSQFTQAQSIPKYSNEFLNIGVGARSLAMAKSVTASSNDVYAGFWNPAALVEIEDNLQIGYMHSGYWSGVANYDYGGLAFRLKNQGAIGISMVRFGIDNIPNTFDLIRNGQIDYNRVSAFSAVDYAFLLSYAQKTTKTGLSFGGNAKVVHRKAGQFGKSWGFGIDASMRYKTENNWYFAVMAKDITSTFNAWRFSFTDAEKEILTQTNNEIPENSLEITLPSFTIGVAKQIEFNDNFGMLAEINTVITTDGKRNTLISADPLSVDPTLGLEFNYKKLVFLRGGMGNIQQITQDDLSKSWNIEPNTGLGLKLGNIHLDYALSTVGKTATGNYTHVFSVKFVINKTEKEKKTE